MPAEFMSGTAWQGSSGPYLNRNVHTDDLWPQGAGDGKDTLEDGLHPVLGIGDQVNHRETQIAGVVVTYNAAITRAVLNIAPGFITKQYVTNITGYAQGNANAWAATIEIGHPIYLDDSNDLALGCTLSMSPANDAGLTNPRVGVAFYDQTEDEDVGIGGHNVDAWPKSFTDGSSTHELLINVMLWPESY